MSNSDEILGTIIFCMIFIFIIFIIVYFIVKRNKSIKEIKDFLSINNYPAKFSMYIETIFDNYNDSNEIQVSSQTVNKFSYDPLPCLIKYFGMQITQDSYNCLIQFENDLNNIYNHIGNNNYKYEYFNNFLPRYCMYYISPQGNSSKEHIFLMDLKNTQYLIKKLGRSFNKNNAKSFERLKLTPFLRESVLKRDNFTCQNCGNSIYNEPNLLLEIDHIIPISRGGKTELNNLQTLCWKCNRSKGSNV